MRVIVCGPDTFIDSFLSKADDAGVRAVAVAQSPAVAADLLTQGGFDAAVLGFPLTECEALLKECPPEPHVPVLVSVGEGVRTADWVRLIGYGATPVKAGTELDELAKLAGARPPQREETGPPLPDDLAEFAAQDRAARVDEVRRQTRPTKVAMLRQRVFAFHSPKGGEGKTTLAVAFASSAAKLAKLKVALVDLDHTREGSDVARRFGYFFSSNSRPPVTLSSWQDFPEEEWRLWDTVQNYVVPTQVEGLYILPSPWDVVEAGVVTRDLVSRVITTLKWHFDLVVVDTPPDLLEGVVEALDQADIVVVVCRPYLDEADVLAGFARRTVAKLRFPREKIRLVFNMVPPDLPYSTRDVAANAGLVEAASVPADPAVAKVRFAGGVPDATVDTPFGRAVEGMVRSFLPEGLLPEPARGGASGRRGLRLRSLLGILAGRGGGGRGGWGGAPPRSGGVGGLPPQEL